MRRAVGVLGVILLVLLSFGLYQGSYRVKEQEKHLRQLDADIVKANEAVRVMKAEWTWLNQPERLQGLARRHLTLVPTAPAQIVILANLPERGASMPPAIPSIEASQLPFRAGAAPASPSVRVTTAKKPAGQVSP